MRRIDGHELWIGNAVDLRDPRRLLDSGVGAIVELADSEQLAELPRDLIRYRFPLSDGGDNPAWLLRLAVESVAALLQANVPTVVCCSAGMSRSLCIAAAAIALVEGTPFKDSIARVAKEGPADVSPALVAQLQQALDP